jgi:hypothetical protein
MGWAQIPALSPMGMGERLLRLLGNELADKLGLLMVNHDCSEIISYWNPERTGIKLVDAQSAIRYFNEVLAFARNIDATQSRKCGFCQLEKWSNRSLNTCRAKQSAAVAIQA